MEESKNLPQPLVLLKGMQLASVVFIRDYTQLHFDGPILTIFNNPYVLVKGKHYSWETAEFCKSMRDCIGVAVIDAQVTKEKISLKFANTIYLIISLAQADYRGPEAAMFTSEDNPTVIF